MLKTIEYSAGATLQVVVLSGPLMVLGMLVWASNRGFDITDEGMYLLISQYPEKVLASATLAYPYMALMNTLAGGNVAVFRVLGYLLLIGSALCLWAGVRRFAHAKPGLRFDDLGGAGLVTSGTLLYYVWFLPTPSYNLLNIASVYFFGGALLLGLSAADGARKRKHYAMWFTAGLAVGLSLFVKFPTAILMFTVACVGSLIWAGSELSERGTRVAMLTAGCVTWIVLHLLLFQTSHSVYSVFTRGLHFAHQVDARYSTVEEISRVFIGTWGLLASAFQYYKWIYLIAAVAAVMFVLLPSGRRTRTNRFDWMLLVSTGALVYFALSVHWYTAGVGHMNKIAPLVGGSLLLALAWRVGHRLLAGAPDDGIGQTDRRNWLLVLLLLVALPFVAAIGTNSPLAHIIALCLAPWLAAVWMVFNIPSDEGTPGWLRWLLPAVLGALCSAQVFDGCLNDPYRLHGGLLSQNVATAVGSRGSKLYLDASAHHLLTDLKKAANRCGIRTDMPVLAFYDIPGLVYAIGAYSPGMPWYLGRYPNAASATNSILVQIPREILASAPVLITSPPHSALPKLLRSSLHFPERYRNCAVLSLAPYFAVGRKLSIWLPKQVDAYATGRPHARVE